MKKISSSKRWFVVWLFTLVACQTQPMPISTPTVSPPPTISPTSAPPTSEPTATAETEAQYYARIAKAEYDAASSVKETVSANNPRTWTHTEEGRNFAQIAYEPSSWDDNAPVKLDTFMRAMRLIEYDEIIEHGRGIENIETMRENIWNAIGGLMNDPKSADTVRYMSGTELKNFINALTPEEQSYVEIMRSNFTKQAFRPSPVEAAWIMFGPQSRTQYNQNDPQANGNGVYGFNRSFIPPDPDLDKEYTIPLFGKNFIAGYKFTQKQKYFSQSFFSGTEFVADFVTKVDLSTNKYLMRKGMLFHIKDTSTLSDQPKIPQFYIMQVVVAGDTSVKFSQSSNYIYGSFAQESILSQISIPSMTFETNYTIPKLDGDRLISEDLPPHILTEEVLDQMTMYPFAIVIVKPDYQTAPYAPSAKAEIGLWGQGYFWDQEIFFPVIGHRSDEPPDKTATYIIFRNDDHNPLNQYAP